MFTRRGDSGETDTGLRIRVGKDSPMVDLEGTLDELNTFVGFALINSKWEDIKNDLKKIQNDIFVIGEDITAESTHRTIKDEDVRWLEESVKKYREEIGKIHLFIVPDGDISAVSLHMARAVARRTERLAVYVSKKMQVNKYILIYLNRLSSLLFMHALASNKRLGIEERIWDIKRTS
ncbi:MULTISPECIES: cob(I)yrinic acid a,c-diamide adenosyltransferase [Acidiplasma]|jgi:ATP:cob(I)alamin adenosyltransferase|uniref:Cobalamin adenosyltransferase n=2 Tax=Acidiplasma TaxID=507753 RepID=A0A0Q0WIP8_9ARCH|nr:MULTISPECIES: cob(I)yrinic acid a,c-diamide adenosyltransferase [Acidiplasma]KJE48895.1 ATP--cobalamin adenosyltransferase [Acidiplasma sp. MBA-1]KPV46633.1 cobalamin adenosyltransferase [Acidiplasma aeolicum]KQB33961.1 cobalamin adenosyltransferase [Acidiplasma aeolicum]KQB35477.1 cobalamin adenosyltransferase [Acidiplasma cupricumulans]WMT54302.1 MAG: cob(I)yrinic acid a,c-diamide adenosyltransferase [Acidiplasma sp.]